MRYQDNQCPISLAIKGQTTCTHAPVDHNCIMLHGHPHEVGPQLQGWIKQYDASENLAAKPMRIKFGPHPTSGTQAGRRYAEIEEWL